MALKQVSFNYTLDKECHQVKITDCPTCVSTCVKTKVLELPFLKRCGTCQNVALRLKDSALVVQECEESLQKTILGTITSWTQLVDSNGCPLSEYLITFEYDDALVVGAVQLTYNDIDDWDCFSVGDEYLNSKLGCAMDSSSTLTQDVETGTITFTNEDGDEFTAEVVSADAGNIISAGSDGGAYAGLVDSSRTVFEADVDSGAIEVDVTEPGIYALDTGGIITIVNPDPVATMRLIQTINAEISGVFIPGHIGKLLVGYSINAGAYGDVEKNWKNSGSSDYVGDYPVQLTATDFDTLLAGSGNYSVQIRLRYETTAQGSGGTEESFVLGFVNAYRILGIVGTNT